MPDSVFLEGIRFHGFHGLTRLEREIGVRYIVDLELRTDLSTACETDRLADTIDYRKVHRMVVEIGRRESYKLIETLAAHLAREILDTFPVREVRVRLGKETPVLDGIVDSVGVEISRTRSETRSELARASHRAEDVDDR
jgi:dihydroneopterin aldolase